MAVTQIDGGKQIKSATITTTQLAAAAGITDGQLANGANYLKKDGSVALTGNLAAGGNRITGLGNPSADQDAATKAYVDGVVQGLDVHPSVRVATTANITLSGTQTIDGVALSVNDRVLVKDQSTASANGIYTVQSGAWTRATDADASAELSPGAFVFVEEGTAGADTGWVMTANAPFTLGTTACTWSQFSGAGQITAGGGLTKNGNTLDVGAGVGIAVATDSVAVDYDTGTIDLNGNKIRVKSGVWAPTSHAHAGGDITSGQVGIAYGGTGASLSATGPGFLKQASTGANVTVGAIAAADLPSGIDATKIGAGSVSNTEFGYLDGVTSAIQTQLAGKADSGHNHDATYAPIGASYIVQTANGALTGEQALSALATGLLKNTTGTGVLSIANPGTDYAAASHVHADYVEVGTLAPPSGTYRGVYVNNSTYSVGSDDYLKRQIVEKLTGTYAAGNTTITLSATPWDSDLFLDVFVGGLRLHKTDDWTISGTTITFPSIDFSGQNIVVRYLA